MAWVKCKNCPLLGSDLACPASWSNHRRFCEWVDPAHRDYIAHGREILIRMAEQGLPPWAPGDELPEQPSSFVPPVAEPMPPMWQRAKNFAGALIEHAIAGFPEVSEEVFQQRITTCRACEHYDRIANACRVCGCISGIKARWTEQRCPKKKW